MLTTAPRHPTINDCLGLEDVGRVGNRCAEHDLVEVLAQCADERLELLVGGKLGCLRGMWMWRGMFASADRVWQLLPGTRRDRALQRLRCLL